MDFCFCLMLSKLPRTSAISTALALVTLSVISLKSLADSYRTVTLINNNTQTISTVRMRVVNTKKWYYAVPLREFFDPGDSKTFNVSTDQCTYDLRVDYISASYEWGHLNVCNGKTTPITITYTGDGGDFSPSGRYLGDKGCPYIPTWVPGIHAVAGANGYVPPCSH